MEEAGQEHGETLTSPRCGFQTWVYITITWEPFFKTRISGLHTSRTGWAQSLWTERMAEFGCSTVPLTQALWHHFGWNGKKQFSAYLPGHCLLFFRPLEWFSPTTWVSAKFKLLLTPMVAACVRPSFYFRVSREFSPFSIGEQSHVPSSNLFTD